MTTDTINISVRIDSEQKAKLEALAHDYGQCSQSAVIRQNIEEQYYQVFGGLDPDALAHDRVSDDQLRQVINGADPEDVVGESLLADDTGEGESEDTTEPAVDTASAAATDGGAMVSPGSYTMTIGPNELRQSGPELTWDRLREVVTDDAHWDESLTIHPDRVSPDELKSSHKYTTRIILAMLRHKATADEFVTEGMVEDMIDEYLVPLCDRVDEHAARRYIHETYRPLIEDLLYETPAPNAKGYFTTEAGQVDAAEAILEDGLDVPEYIDRAENVLDVDRWHRAVGISGQTDESLDHWLDDVATLMESVAAMKSVVMVVNETHRIPADYPETYTGLGPYLISLKDTYCELYIDQVATKCSDKVRERMSDVCVDILASDGV